MSADYIRAVSPDCAAALNARAGERPPGPVQQLAGIVATVAMMAASVAMVVAVGALKRQARGVA